MESSDTDEIEKWELNREAAYLGSKQHFLSSLIKNNFVDEGFVVWNSKFPYQIKYEENPIIDGKAVVSKYTDNLYELKYDDYLRVSFPGTDHSWLQLTLGQVFVDKYGYSSDVMPFEVRGRWAFSGIAHSLPNYFAIAKE